MSRKCFSHTLLGLGKGSGDPRQTVAFDGPCFLKDLQQLTCMLIGALETLLGFPRLVLWHTVLYSLYVLLRLQ